MSATNLVVEDYNAHAVDNGNTRNKAFYIKIIHNKLAIYRAFEAIICTGCIRSKWFNPEARDKIPTFLIGINLATLSTSADS